MADKRHDVDTGTIPPDAADYLHGDQMTYPEKDGGHIMKINGRQVNLNTVPTFDDYYDGPFEGISASDPDSGADGDANEYNDSASYGDS
jgi:hypothetical protein